MENCPTKVNHCPLLGGSTNTHCLLTAGDQIEVTAADANEEWWEGKVVRTGKTGSFQILFTQGWESVQTSRPGMKRVNSRKPSVGKISFGETKSVRLHKQVMDL